MRSSGRRCARDLGAQPHLTRTVARTRAEETSAARDDDARGTSHIVARPWFHRCSSPCSPRHSRRSRSRRHVTYDLVVRGGRVVTAHEEFVADVAVTGGTIAAIGTGLRGTREIDAAGKLVLPGAIDGHVHMRTERPQHVYDDDWTSGTTAAAFGGVTTIIDQAQVEPGLTLTAGVDARLAEAEGQSLVDYGLHVNLREPNLERIGGFEGLTRRGMPSFKVYMTYDTYMLPDAVIFAAMQEIGRLGGLLCVHAESDVMIRELLRQNAAAGRSGLHANAAARPPEMEGEAVHRALAMARVAGSRTLIYHVTAEDGVREIELARGRG